MKLSGRITVLNIAGLSLIVYMIYGMTIQPITVSGESVPDYVPMLGIGIGILGLIFDQILQASIRSKARLFVIEVGVIMLCLRGLIFIFENNVS